MNAGAPVRCLLVANIFPPIRGGSAVVYDNMCRFGPPGTMMALASRVDYRDGRPIEGWQANDAQAPYPIERVRLLRPPIRDAPSRLGLAWSYFADELPLKALVAAKVARLVRRHGIRVVCIGELVSGSWVGLFAKRWLGCRLIIYIHGEEITTELNYRRYGQRRREYLQAADAVVAVSRFTRDALVERMGVDPARIALIYNGVDVERFTPGPADAALVERYGLAGKRVLLSVGRLVARKGIDTTLKALPRIRERFPDVHYLVVGIGPYREALERLAHEVGVAEHVTFAGLVPAEELVDHYRLSELFVMPNREMPDGDTEGFGLVFLEANACGRAVIGGRAGGVPDAVEEGRNGLLVDGNDPRAVAEATVRLLGDDALRRRLEEQGLALARASGWPERAREFHDLCRRLVEGAA